MVSLPPPAAAGRDPAASKRGLCFDRTEVTVADYAACVKRGRCGPPLSYDPKFEDDLYRAFCNWQSPDARDQHPINCVTFEQARLYCESRGARLPTDVEWRWVASNQARTRYPWGAGAPDGERVNGCGLECPAAVKTATGNPELRATYAQNDGYAATAPVGSFVKGDTASGIHDLGGNVSEFVVAVESRASSGDLTAGGSCLSQDLKLMAADRFTRTAWAHATSPSLGFRCASD